MKINLGIRNIRSLTDFLKVVKIKPGYLLLAVSFSLAAALLEGISTGLLIPLLRGIINMNFDFLKEYPLVISAIDRLPIILNSQKITIFVTIIGVIFFSSVLKYALQYISALAVASQVRKLSHNLRILIFTRYLSFGKLFFDLNGPGHLNNILMGFTQRIAFQLMVQQSLLNNVLFVAVYLVIMFFVSWKLTIIALLFSPILVYALNLVIARIRATSVSSAECEKLLARDISNALSCVPLVKFYTQEANEVKRFSATSAMIRKLEFSMDKKQNIVSPFQEIFVLTAVLLLASVMAFMAIRQKTTEAAALLVYFYLLKRCLSSFNAINSSRSHLATAGGPIKEVRKILDDKDKYFVPDGTKQFGGLHRHIQFTDLSFSYKKGVETLKNVTFSIEKGKMIAIVGPTGSGKTTIINLLVRFYDCPPGAIFIDGTDVRDFTLNTLRAGMAIVSQDTLLFDDTIRNNITYGSEQPVSDEKLHDILKKARLDSFIKNLPDGVNTYVGDRGVQLSGGEKQRISIARAFLREPKILILDEATSSLDTRTEKLIQEAIEDIVKGKTTIVIAHRLSTIKNADKIVAIEEGRIVEEGGLAELLSKKGKFYMYWEEQKFY